MALALIKSFSVAALCDVTSEHLQIPHGRSLRQQIIAIIITFIVVGMLKIICPLLNTACVADVLVAS